METETISSVSVTTPTTSTSSVNSTITSDFDTFLQLLSAQLEYQDPLDPLESTDFAVQLATFSGVEQQVLSNELLVALGDTLAASSVADMANWIGTVIRAPMPAYYDGDPVTISPNPAAISDKVELVVTNEEGDEIERKEIPVSAEPFEWSGKDEYGIPYEDGIYFFEIVSYSEGQVILQEPAEVYGEVQEVVSEGGQILLVLEGDVAVASSQVSALSAVQQ
jgi:flagellar basal-body rod modification protein FlgD